MSPVATSSAAELTDANIDTSEKFLGTFVDRWYHWVDEAEELPEEQRIAQQKYDFTVRELGYSMYPMNVLTQRIFGQDEFNRRLDMRCGMSQMAETRRY